MPERAVLFLIFNHNGGLDLVGHNASYVAHLSLIITQVQHKDIWYTKGAALYIVIITEEETCSPRRCETAAATDTEAPRASNIKGVGHTVS